MKLRPVCLLLVAIVLTGSGLTGANELRKLLSDMELAWSKSPEPKPTPFDWLLQDFMAQLVGQRPSNENGTRSEFKAYALSDTSNDDAVKMTAQELITRSGFKYEEFKSIAQDGYVTPIIRMINPLADPKRLRQPPVLLEHGGTTDSTAYLVASSIQHHPEPWPRTAQTPPITSWNRSLAFTLCNNGFDVYMAETRGANERNLRMVRTVPKESKANRREQKSDEQENALEVITNSDYWNFSQDDIINYELRSHMDTVMNLTQAERLHIITFSLSTPTALAFFATQPEYARKVQGFVSMSPIFTGDGLNLLLRNTLEVVCPQIPDAFGHILFTTLFTNQRARDLMLLFARNKLIRYTVLKAFITYFLGPSAKYETLLELNLLGHLFRKLSFKEAKQMCQQMSSDQLQKYDYGPLENKRLYNQTTPPVYDLSNLELSDWIIVSGANDKLATLEMADNLIKTVNPKPAEHIIVPGYNHMDMLAGYGNDKNINLPIVNYLIKMSHFQIADLFPAASARELDVTKLLPADLKLESIQDSLDNVGEALKKPDLFLESLQKGVTSMFENLSKAFMLNFPPKAESSPSNGRSNNNITSRSLKKLH